MNSIYKLFSHQKKKNAKTRQRTQIKRGKRQKYFIVNKENKLAKGIYEKKEKDRGEERSLKLILFHT